MVPADRKVVPTSWPAPLLRAAWQGENPRLPIVRVSVTHHQQPVADEVGRLAPVQVTEPSLRFPAVGPQIRGSVAVTHGYLTTIRSKCHVLDMARMVRFEHFPKLSR